MEVIEYCGLGLWIIYVFLFVNREIGRKNKYIKEYKKELIIRKPFHVIRIDTLFFLLVYIVYADFADNRVLPYLYLIIVITNIVYCGYDIADNYKNKRNIKKELPNYIATFILIFIVLGYLLITENLFNTCMLTLGLNLLVPVYVWVIAAFKKC